jgi:hypothetical protein
MYQAELVQTLTKSSMQPYFGDGTLREAELYYRGCELALVS